MKKSFLLSLLLMFFFINSFGQTETKRVLFLGNSYTGVNNLPLLCSNLTEGTNKTLIYDSNTPGGYTLEQHATNSTSLDKIKQGNWDFVVLQEQSQIPTIDFYRYNSMYPGVKRLNDSIKKYNSCANVVMYMTWGRRHGGMQCDQEGIYCSPDFVDFSHMQDSLESAYCGIADTTLAYVAPVGIAWRNVLENTENILHSGDNSHPNFSGSYLAACVFYSVFWDESPVGLTYYGDLSDVLATYFQEIAEETVFSTSDSDWNLNIDKPTADFSFDILDNSVQFTNLSQSMSPADYTWYFDDGDISTEENPFHTYIENQIYTISLVTKYCSKKDSIAKEITINTTGFNDANINSKFAVFPNPVSNKLTVNSYNSSDNLKIELINSVGELMNIYNFKNKKEISISLNNIPAGLYFLKIIDLENNSQTVFKIIKK